MDIKSSGPREIEPLHYPTSAFSGTYPEPKSKLAAPVSYVKSTQIDTSVQSYVSGGRFLPADFDYSSRDVIFSYYGFLESDLMSHISPQDVNFLESQACFRVPTRPVLDEFVREYFLHVHPNLPMINEGTFWEMYTHQGYYPSERPRLSLFVFQAMLFASCSVSCRRCSTLSLSSDQFQFVSLETIRSLGYTTTRSARENFFRQAKVGSLKNGNLIDLKLTYICSSYSTWTWRETP